VLCRNSVLGLRDAFVSVNEWISAVDEDAERFAQTLATSTNEQIDDWTDTMGDATVQTADLVGVQEDLSGAIKNVEAAVGRMRKAFSGNLFGEAFSKRKFEQDLLTAGGVGSGQTREFATGGTVGGPRGAPSLAVVHGGEQISTPGQQRGGGNMTVNFNGVVGDPVAVAQEIQELLDLNGQTGG